MRQPVEDRRADAASPRGAEDGVYRDLFDNAPDAYVVTDERGTIRSANRLACSLFGLAPDGLVGRPLDHFFRPDERDRIRRCLADPSLSGDPVVCHEAVALSGGEREVPVSCHMSAVAGAGGTVSGFRFLLRDVSAQKSAERELRLHEEMLRRLVDNTTAVIYAKHVDGRYIFFNTQFAKLFNVTLDECRGKTDYDIFPKANADAFRANDLAVVHAARPIESEEQAPHADGLHTYISLKFPLIDVDGTPYAMCGISTDITERIRARELERRHLTEIAHAWRLATVGEMVSILAHEINQPLFAIVNYARGGIRRVRTTGADEAGMLEALESIARQAERAGEIVRRLRAFVRKDEPTLSPVDLNDIVREVSGLEVLEAKPNSVRVNLDLARSLPRVMGDAIQLEQVLLNLMRNAVDAMLAVPEDERELRLRTSREPDGRVLLEVSDTGRGIPPEIAEKVFESFFTTKPRGMGLGLAICRSIVEAHGGRLDFRSDSGRGTTFFFALDAVSEGA